LIASAKLKWEVYALKIGSGKFARPDLQPAVTHQPDTHHRLKCNQGAEMVMCWKAEWSNISVLSGLQLSRLQFPNFKRMLLILKLWGISPYWWCGISGHAIKALNEIALRADEDAETSGMSAIHTSDSRAKPCPGK